MRKIKILCMLGILSVVSAKAQNAFNEGDKVINAGIGIGNYYYSGSGYTSKFPLLSVSFEYGVKDNLFDNKSSLGIGGYLGYTAAKWTTKVSNRSEYGWSSTDFILGVRGVFHYQLVDKLDTYTGLFLGYRIHSWDEIGNWSGNNYTYSSSGGVTGGWFIGARYYFTDNIAGLAEIGYGISWLTLGAAVKF